MMSMGKVPRAVAALALLVLVLGTPAAARTGSGDRPDGAETSLTLKQAGRDFLYDAGRIWSAPSRIKKRDVAPLLALAATASFLIVADEEIRDAVQGYVERHSWVDDVGPVITRMGDMGAWVTAGAFFGTGLVLKDARARDTGTLAASAIVQTFLVDNVLKGLTGRQRPYYADGVDHWSGPAGFIKRYEKESSGRYVSFPSGHTATAFSVATVVALQYRRPIWVPILAYAVASGVGLSRMTMDRHWASDVVCGAILGHVIARLVVRNHDRRQRLVPTLACSRRGVALSLLYDLDPAGR
jgi:membrane-associated phospholipid phosphatase